MRGVRPGEVDGAQEEEPGRRQRLMMGARTTCCRRQPRPRMGSEAERTRQTGRMTNPDARPSDQLVAICTRVGGAPANAVTDLNAPRGRAHPPACRCPCSSSGPRTKAPMPCCPRTLAGVNGGAISEPPVAAPTPSDEQNLWMVPSLGRSRRQQRQWRQRRWCIAAAGGEPQRGRWPLAPALVLHERASHRRASATA